MEEEPLSIFFELKAPKDIVESTFNTLVMLINEIRCSYQNLSYPSNSTEQNLYNKLISQAKNELDNLRSYFDEED